MKYLLRLSLDITGKNFRENPRYKDAVASIRALTKPNNKIIVIAHRGRPKGKDKKLSLAPFAKAFSKDLRKKVVFLSDFNFRSIEKKVNKARGGSVFLLENLRFNSGEQDNSKDFAKSLASLGDRYINDDFATAHRKNASNYSLPMLLPSSLGRNIKKELSVLRGVMKTPKKPLVLIIGGAKAEDKLGVLNNFIGKADYILLGGATANTMLKVRGVHIGKSMYDKDSLAKLKKLASKDKIVTPVDWLVSQNAILDIGPNTIDLFKEIIASAKTIVWNGPMGVFENPKFAKGTIAIADALKKNKKARIIVGGGDTLSSLDQGLMRQKHIFTSTGGGAMLELLSGKKLPAVEAIK